MKRVICLYRVSTIGQVDHDDIPMQKTACREYAAAHPDWKIIDEISEKGVSGYKVSTNARDAIIEIKRRAMLHEFDVLLVFMFDRLGRREDETPFVVQWFVQQGIEVWSTKEGEQRFDNHVDKLLNYIRFWQASGESEKTSIRVKTRLAQMTQDGQYTGGLVPYGYRLEYLGRINKKNQPVRDLVIDEEEAAVVREIFRLLADEGYGTVRAANLLNERGIKTKRGTSLWRGTSIRALIDNPIYIGIMRSNSARSEPFEKYRIIDDELYERCLDTVKGRAPSLGSEMRFPQQTKSDNLLAGFIYCAHCGNRLAFYPNVTRRKLADGSTREYRRNMYRCYRKTNSPTSCDGMNVYNADVVIDAVVKVAQEFFKHIKATPSEELLHASFQRNLSIYQVAFKQAETDFQQAHREITALEEQTIKALTGENSIDVSIINTMMPKYREKRDAAQRRMKEAKADMEKEEATNREAVMQVSNVIKWADIFDEANKETRHMILARLINRVEVGAGYKIMVKFKITYEQFLGIAA